MINNVSFGAHYRLTLDDGTPLPHHHNCKPPSEGGIIKPQEQLANSLICMLRDTKNLNSWEKAEVAEVEKDRGKLGGYHLLTEGDLEQYKVSKSKENFIKKNIQKRNVTDLPISELIKTFAVQKGLMAKPEIKEN